MATTFPPIARGSGYLQVCLWGDHYAPASEQDARASQTILACPEHEPLRMAHPDLAVCESGCGCRITSNSLRYYYASSKRHEQAQCPVDGVYDHPWGPQRIVVLAYETVNGDGVDGPNEVALGHVTCVGCGHRFVSRGV